MKRKNIKITEKRISYQGNKSLIWLVCLFSLISIPAPAQLYIGENTKVSVSGEASLYTQDASAPMSRGQKESCKVYVHQGTIISGYLSNDIAYVDRPAEKEKVKQGQFAETREKMTKKSTEKLSRPKQSKPAVYYRASDDSFFNNCSSKQHPVIIAAGNSYKAIVVGLEEYKKKYRFLLKDIII